MSAEIVTARAVRVALHAGRYGKAMDSPLLRLHLVSAGLRADGIEDTPGSRARVLLQVLADLTADALSQRRGERPAARESAILDHELALAAEDFQAGSSEREAWSVVHFRYLTGHDEPMRILAEATGVLERTLRRRLERGCQLLAEVLTLAEHDAAASAKRPHRLPEPLTRFIGRERELADIRALLAHHRLVVLTGLGGIGKSRLAMHLARDLATDYADGVWFVELVAVGDDRQLAGTVARLLGLAEQPGKSPTEGLIAHLTDRSALLVLDNCEHLVPACSDLIRALLQQCPAVEILTTSREALRVRGQAVYVVPPMTRPEDTDAVTAGAVRHYDAVRLFTDRTATALPAFQVTAENAASLARVCEQLEGIPLAIELAAARMPFLSLEQLETRLTDRFGVLTDGRRASRPGHESMAAAIAWSCEMLSAPERALLQRLTVFRGGWTLEAAEAVCSGAPTQSGHLLTLLEELATKSLIDVFTELDRPRFNMLATLQEYASARLDAEENPEHRRRLHFGYYLEFAQTGRKSILGRGPDPHSWLNSFDIEYANLITAMTWALAGGNVEDGLRLAEIMVNYWEARARIADGSQVLEAFLTVGVLTAPTNERAKLLNMTGRLIGRYLDPDRARPLIEEMYEICSGSNDLRGMSAALTGLGQLAESADKRIYYFDQGLAVDRELGDPARVASDLINIGSVMGNEGRLEEANARLQEAVVLFRTMPEQREGLMVALAVLGSTELHLGDLAAAEAHLGQSLEIAQSLGNQLRLPMIWALLGELALARSDLDGARFWLDKALIGYRKLDDLGSIVVTLVDLADLDGATGNPERALGLIGAVESYIDMHGEVRNRRRREKAAQVLERARERVTPTVAKRALRAGRAMTLDQAIDYALETDAEPVVANADP